MLDVESRVEEVLRKDLVGSVLLREDGEMRTSCPVETFVGLLSDRKQRQWLYRGDYLTRGPLVVDREGVTGPASLTIFH